MYRKQGVMSSKPALRKKGTCYARKATSDVSENDGRTLLSLCGGGGLDNVSLLVRVSDLLLEKKWELIKAHL